MTDRSFLTQRGYTLLEMAIVIVVLGLVLASGAAAYNIYHKNKVQRVTVQNASRVINALNHYLIQTGSYPCPARLDVGRDHSAYGMEGECDQTKPGYPSLAVGACGDGICIEEGERQVNVNPSPTGTTMVTPRVRRGAVPFRVLSLAEKDSEDGYGMKLMYAVTENLAVSNTYRKESGGISLVDTEGNTVIQPEASAHFVIFSAGEDRRGGYTRYGSLMNACADVDEAKDALNCHTSSTAPHNKAIYRASSKAVSNTDEHYDDYIRYYASTETPLWRVMGDAETDIVDMIDAASAGQVGINVENPQATVHVGGEVKVSENLELRDLCSSGGANCFAANLIGGDEQVMKCEDGEFVTQIKDGQVKCSSTPSLGDCAPNELMVGINPDNNQPICEGTSVCLQMEVDMCYVDGEMQRAVIPTKIHNTIYQTPVFGSSFQRTFRCNGGTWQQISTSGACNCTPVDNQLQQQACHVSAPGTTPVGDAGKTRCRDSQCWTGMATRYFSRTCPDGEETTTNWNRDNCACAEPHTRSRTRTCSDLGYNSYYTHTGSLPREETHWECTGDSSGRWTGWELVDGTDTCSCTPHDEYDSISCSSYMTGQGHYGPAYSGSIQTTRQVTCGNPPTTPWVPVGNPEDQCTCSSSYVHNYNGDCPGDQIGHIEYAQTMNCATGELNPPEEINRFCSEVIHRYIAVGPQSGEGGQLSDRLGQECPAPSMTIKNCSSPCSACTGGYAYYPCQCQ